MMTSTASLQVCVDLGEAHEAVARWDAVHALGPVLTAVFGNSRVLAGQDTGWVSARLRSTLATAPPATFAPARTPDPVGQYARMALDSPVLCVRREQGAWTAPAGLTFADWVARPDTIGRRPTAEDLDYHLTTLFPPVRPHGYLEVRYLDAQTGDTWLAPVTVLTTLLADPARVDQVLEVTQESADQWLTAARVGLDDDALARTATTVLTMALAALDSAALPSPLEAQVRDQLQQRLDHALSRRCSA